MQSKTNKLKSIAIGIVAIICIIGIFIVYWKFQDWSTRFSSELDRFFGEGNWECIEKETNKSRMVSDYDADRNRRIPKRYQNWYITYTDRYGEEKECVITNHTMIINHKKRFPLSSKWYTAKQALTLELMEVSFDEAGEEVEKEIISQFLTENEMQCMETTISYTGGNPKAKFYSSLQKESWFKANEVTAEDYLTYDLHDFYIYIRIHDYRFEKLTEDEQKHILDSMEDIENALYEKYGNEASFEIYFDSEHKVEYEDGIKI